MSTVRFESSPRERKWFFGTALDLVQGEGGVALLRRFFPGGACGTDARSPKDRADRLFVDRWIDFLKREVSSVTVNTAELERAEAFVEFLMEEAVNRPGFDGSVARSQDRGGRWKPYGGQAPLVVSEGSTCYGCGKIHAGHRTMLGWRLAVGTSFEVPCCPGKDDGLKKDCRLKAVDRVSCCPSCGELNKTRPGKVCRECLQLVDLGAKAKASTGKMALVELGNWSDPHLPYEVRKQLQTALECVLVSMGGRTFGDAGRAHVPELAVLEVRTLLERVNEAVRLAREQGVLQGTDLLGGLASGRISVADFEAKSGRPT